MLNARKEITTNFDLLMQMVMAVFAYIYHQSFIVAQSVSVGMIFDQVYAIYKYILKKIKLICIKIIIVLM